MYHVKTSDRRRQNLKVSMISISMMNSWNMKLVKWWENQRSLCVKEILVPWKCRKQTKKWLSKIHQRTGETKAFSNRSKRTDFYLGGKLLQDTCSTIPALNNVLYKETCILWISSGDLLERLLTSWLSTAERECIQGV